MRQKTILLLSGAFWLFGGISLISKGIRLLGEDLALQAGLLEASALFSNQKSVVAALGCALLIGFVKGRFALAKTVKRTFDRVTNSPKPSFLDTKTVFILLLMLILNRLMTYASIHPFYRGSIDVAIGSALIHGAVSFFRLTMLHRKSLT